MFIKSDNSRVSMLTLAFYQQNIVWEAPQANHRAVEQAFEQTIGSGTHPDILVVPETFNTGFSDTMAQMAEEPQGPTYAFALRMAQRYNALFIGTWTVRQGSNVYNRLHWVAPDGSVGHYDKAHTFRMSSEATQLVAGTRRTTFEWRGWRIKPAVCYDLRFPLWLRNQSRGGLIKDKAPHPDELNPQLDYDLLLICANWPASRHRAWITLLEARAIENQCYVLGVNRVGTDGVGIPYSGNSAAYDFKGLPVVEAQPCTEQVKVAQLDMQELHRFRQHWPFWLDADDEC